VVYRHDFGYFEWLHRILMPFFALELKKCLGDATSDGIVV